MDDRSGEGAAGYPVRHAGGGGEFGRPGMAIQTKMILLLMWYPMVS